MDHEEGYLQRHHRVLTLSLVDVLLLVDVELFDSFYGLPAIQLRHLYVTYYQLQRLDVFLNNCGWVYIVEYACNPFQELLPIYKGL